MYTYVMRELSPLYSPFTPALMLALFPFFVLAMVWTVVLKGFALWHAARGGQKKWFIALLVINTLGILEIVYLIWFRPAASAAPASSSSSAQA